MLAFAPADPFPDPGNLFGVDDVVEGREIVAALRTSGEEEILCDVEEGGSTGFRQVAASLDE
jgi:hypothetical protein